MPAQPPSPPHAILSIFYPQTITLDYSFKDGNVGNSPKDAIAVICVRATPAHWTPRMLPSCHPSDQAMVRCIMLAVYQSGCLPPELAIIIMQIYFAQNRQASGSHLDLDRAPYVLYGVKYIDLVSLAPVSGQRNRGHSAPVVHPVEVLR